MVVSLGFHLLPPAGTVAMSHNEAYRLENSYFQSFFYILLASTFHSRTFLTGLSLVHPLCAVYDMYKGVSYHILLRYLTRTVKYHESSRYVFHEHWRHECNAVP